MVSCASGGTAERTAARSLAKLERAGAGTCAKYSSTVLPTALCLAAESRLPGFGLFICDRPLNPIPFDRHIRTPARARTAAPTRLVRALLPVAGTFRSAHAACRG